jgi:beta-galactosidase
MKTLEINQARKENERKSRSVLRALTCLALSLFFAVLTGFFSSCSQQPTEKFIRNADFNAGWEFHMGDISDPGNPGSNENDWIPVHLPHDWSIIDYKVQDSLYQGPFYKDLPGGVDVGYLRNGVGWYRKVFVSPENSESKHLLIGFDGVQTQMELWVNGTLIGEHVYGYTPFYFDVTTALKGPGEKNMIAVKTVNPGENSRWFAGAGIYRPVTLSLLDPVSIEPWGVYVKTPQVSADLARVVMEISVGNKRTANTEISAEILIYSPDGQSYKQSAGLHMVEANSKAMLSASVTIKEPSLWNTNHPDLYKAQVRLMENGLTIDSYELMFGIRSITYSAEQGFLLNGDRVLMKGACMHHDNGLLGAAAFPDAEYRRVKMMKESGYNAIRTSHNPPSESFLKACDELGMLVIDESFDQWVEPKRPNDYSNYFKEWHTRDIEAMVYRDRNHPSVVMWSFGNEVKERADPEGIEIGKALAAAIREVDDTRPVTQAVCGFWDNPGKEWDYSVGAFSMLDIGGYNYQFLNYESDHARFPERIMYGSESVPQHAWENWEMVKRHSYVIGDFVWTGMDYIGESGIGHQDLVDQDSIQEGSFLKSWPWYLSWCGDMDILGNKKPQSYYRDILWGESNLEMVALRPVPEGKREAISYWGWPDELKSWNWEGYEGVPIKVKVYTSYPKVSLELNGVAMGTLMIDSLSKYTAQFEVPYAPGELKATAISENGEEESLILKTSGPATQLASFAERTMIPAHRNALAFIHVLARDQNGQEVVYDDSEIRVRVSGPAILLAAGNAAPEHQGSFTDNSFRLFRGRGLVIVRSTGEPGTIAVELSSVSMGKTSVILEAE